MSWKFWDRWKKPQTGTVLVLRAEWDNCAPDLDVVPDPIQPRAWEPQDFAVKIMIAGDLSRIRSMSENVMDVQTSLMKQFEKDSPNTKLYFSVGTFLDGCRHDTDWTSNPADIGSNSTRWHCFQSNTQFCEAIDQLRLENQKANIVLLVGERFDDDLNATIAAARKLFEKRGTRVFCLSGHEGNMPGQYQEIAKAGGGVCLPRLNEHGDELDASMIVDEITQNVFARLSGKNPELLPLPASDEAKKIRALLQDLRIK